MKKEKERERSLLIYWDVVIIQIGTNLSISTDIELAQ